MPVASGRCGGPFRVGHEYVVYAKKSDETSRLTIASCARTRDVEDAAADLSYARGLKDGTPTAGRISGQVVAMARNLPNDRAQSSRPVPGLTVRLTRQTSLSEQAPTVSVTTNEAGDFAFDVHEVGAYVVSLDVPDRFYAEHSAVNVELRDPRSCVEVNRILYDNGRVRGRVVDASGSPVAGLTIDLSSSSGAPLKRTISDPDGRYEFARLPAGRYLIGLNTGHQRSTATRQPQLFYPGVEKSTAAGRIAVGAGSRVELEAFRVPAQMRYVAISGVVFDPDGLPAEGARVYLKGAGDDDSILSEPATADRSGRFVIAALAGEEYRLFAERSRASAAGQRVDSTDQVPLAVAAGLKPIRLMLRRRY